MTSSPLRRTVGPFAILAVAAALGAGTVACGASGGGGSDGASIDSSSSPTEVDGTTTTAPLGPQPEPRGAVLVADDFDRADGVVTDERTWHDDTGTLPPDDEIWAATSGVLRSEGGEGWSDSPVFRVVTHRRDIGDVAVSFRLRTEAPVGDDQHPEEAWDGVHLLLQYQDEADLYAVSVARRDGELAIKRKDPGGPSNGGTYTTLATGPGAVAPGRWTDVVVTIRNGADGIEITVGLDGKPVLETVDREAVGDRASKPGRVGIRADNTTFRLDDVVVKELDAAEG